MNALGPFLVPGAFALLALVPAIVVMYLLKLKRSQVEVPSTLLWRRSVQDMIANAPFQKLRNNLLLWLQILALLLVIFALARPVMKLTGLGGETIILLIDLSASMQTEEEGGRTRLDLAKDLAFDAIDEIGGGTPQFVRSLGLDAILPSFGARDEMMVVGFADTPVILQPLTSDRGALRAAVLGAKARDVEADMTDLGYILEEKTMVYDAEALVPNENARVILISDGAVGPTVEALADVVNVDFTTVGTAGGNVGFTGIDVRESFSGELEYQVFATLIGSTEEPMDVFVELSIDGEVFDLRQVTLEPGEPAGVVFTLSETVEGLATLRLVDHADPLALDDVIRAHVSPPADLDILIVTRGNSFLETVFTVVDPRTTVSVVRPEEYAPLSDHDIVVFDDCTVPEIGLGNFIFINDLPPGEIGYTLAGEELSNPQIIDYSRVHPITRYLGFDDVLVGQSLDITAPEQAIALVEAVETDLISYLESEQRRVLVIAFDPNNSYWPVHKSFPMFFKNLLEYWSRTGRRIGSPAYATGQTIPIAPPREAAEATITTPTGRELTFDLEGRTTLYLTDTAEAGVYTVAFDTGATQRLPVGLQSPLESDIRVVEELQFGGRTLEATAGEVRTRQELWPWLLLLGLGILLVEWAIYCRRSFM